MYRWNEEISPWGIINVAYYLLKCSLWQMETVLMMLNKRKVMTTAKMVMWIVNVPLYVRCDDEGWRRRRRAVHNRKQYVWAPGNRDEVVMMMLILTWIESKSSLLFMNGKNLVRSSEPICFWFSRNKWCWGEIYSGWQYTFASHVKD